MGNEVCYYLGSRFYSPRLGRFLNADKHTDTSTGVNGTNMFAHCNNNEQVIDYQELYMFAAVVYAEAGGESDLCIRAMDYYNNNIYSSTIEKRAMDNTLKITRNVYTGKDKNISNGATYFYSPRYAGDEWYYADSYEQVYIDGISSDVFMFYK